MDFLNRLLNRPTAKPAICHGSADARQHRRVESAGEAFLPPSRPESEPEHPIRFSRDFSEVASTSSGPSSLAQESLSSASSFQSLASTLSSKSSSGICADSAPGSPDKVNTGNGFDHSYVNVDIPDLDDIISACANINLNNAAAPGESADELGTIDAESPADLSLDQTFTSAADDTVADETQVLVEETIQTFDTCPPLLVTKATSSVIPYVSFEESVLRKHQEPTNDGTEFKSALTSFQAGQFVGNASTDDTRRRSYSPTPCEEIDVARVAKFASNSPKQEKLANATEEVVAKKEDSVEQNYGLCTPDASFQEVQTFDSTVVLNVDPIAREPKTPESLETTVSNIPSKSAVPDQGEKRSAYSLDEVPVGVKTKEREIEQEAIPNELNKSQDIIQDTDVLNKTQDIVQDTNVLNKTQNIVEDINVLNKTQDIDQDINTLNKAQGVQEQNILNNTQDIVEKESNVIKAELIEEKLNKSVSKNQVIVQETNNLDKTDNVQTESQILKKEDDAIEFDERPIKSQIQEPKSPKTVESNTLKTPQKSEETFLKPEVKNRKQKENFTNEEPHNLSLINSEPASSTPLPVKNLNKITPKSPKPPKSPKRKSALFTNEPELIKSQGLQVLTQNSKSLNKSAEIKEEKNKLNFDQTLAVNKSFEKSSFCATDYVTDLEAIANPLTTLLTQEPEYEAFKPVQQSTSLPFVDYLKLQEPDLSIAKEIEESLERIEETEHFVSATTELFDDPSALDFLTHVGSQQPTRRGERYDSLYTNFDPLAQRLSMLPQKNLPPSQTVDDVEEKEKETKAETPSSETATPMKNPALAAIDRLLFFSPSPNSETESAVAEAKQKKEEPEKQASPVVPIVDEKMAKELEMVRSAVIQLESELEKQKQEHKEKLEKYETKFSHMQTQLSEEVKCKSQMSVVVEEYEKSISRLIAEREKDRTNFEIEKGKLQEELHVANQHLSNTEAAFSDVHSKYERLKNVVSAYKSNETVLKESIAENQATIKTLESRYEQMKSHAVAQLEKANLELVSIRKQNEAENVKLKALVRKAELKSKSLAETVEQKTKENKELTQIIDEMIARVD